MPSFGGLHDPELRGLSAEAIYDRIVCDIRKYRKLATIRGFGLCDILDPSEVRGRIVDADEFCRRALAQGLALHQKAGRGLLPGQLVQEIEALSVPPIPWDVKLAQWLDGFFAPTDPRRTYARASRRQSATPDIPRPRVVPFSEEVVERTFGVVLDTSGSMDRTLLGQGLGAISSYALSREVPLVRVVFCDAVAYDEGYLAPETIAGRVKVRGRGGTILQPGVNLLERATDFPKDGPILIVTDALCDHVRCSRDHAFLVPPGARLPFVARGPVFEMEAVKP
jgi:predicted metal-dependent peptidase